MSVVEIGGYCYRELEVTETLISLHGSAQSFNTMLPINNAKGTNNLCFEIREYYSRHHM